MRGGGGGEVSFFSSSCYILCALVLFSLSFVYAGISHCLVSNAMPLSLALVLLYCAHGRKKENCVYCKYIYIYMYWSTRE